MSIAVLGEALIDFIPGGDGAYRPHPGGSPFNVAIGLARQGIGVSYLSPFSDDLFGGQLRAALLAEGVRLPLARRSARPTSLALVTVDDQGIPRYRLYRQGVADKDTTYEEICAHLPPDLRLLHTGSLAITPSQVQRIRQLFTLLKARGVLISVDVNIRLKASADTAAYLEGVRSLFPYCDILKASDEDLEALAPGREPVQAARVAHREMQSGLFVLTRGNGGAILLRPGGELQANAYPVSRTEDTVGAGDTFHAAFLASLARRPGFSNGLAAVSGDLLVAALDYACAAAAINISRVGCSPPTQLEVDDFVAAARR